MEYKENSWIYAPLPEYEEFFQKIEKALGFKLFVWQKYFIAWGQKYFIAWGVWRRLGKTTAQHIRRLVMDKEPVYIPKKPRNAREKFENEELIRIYEKLKAGGVPTCEVIFKK